MAVFLKCSYQRIVDFYAGRIFTKAREIISAGGVRLVMFVKKSGELNDQPDPAKFCNPVRKMVAG